MTLYADVIIDYPEEVAATEFVAFCAFKLAVPKSESPVAVAAVVVDDASWKGVAVTAVVLAAPKRLVPRPRLVVLLVVVVENKLNPVVWLA